MNFTLALSLIFLCIYFFPKKIWKAVPKFKKRLKDWHPTNKSLITVADPGFPRGGGANRKGGGGNLLFCQICSKNCMKMKKIGLRGARPLRPPWIRQCIIISESLQKSCCGQKPPNSRNEVILHSEVRTIAVCHKYPSRTSIFTDRVRSTTEDYVFTGVCLLTPGGGYPAQVQIWGVPKPSPRGGGTPDKSRQGVPQPSPDGGGVPQPSPNGGGVPQPGADGGYPMRGLPPSRDGVSPQPGQDGGTP